MRHPQASFYGLIGGLLIGAVLTLFASNAHSAINFAGTNFIVATPSGGGTSQTIRFSEAPTLQYGQPSSKAATIQQTMNLPITGGKATVTVPITSKQVIPKAKIGAYMGKLAKGLVPGVVVAGAVLDALQLAGYHCDLTGCHTIAQAGTSYAATQSGTQVAQWKISTLYTSDGAYGLYPQSTFTIYQACSAAGSGWVYTGTGYCRNSGGQNIASTTTATAYTYSCPSGGTLSGTTCNVNAQPATPITDDQVADAIPDSAIQPAIEQALQDPNQTNITPDSPQLSGPASVTSPTSTTTVFNPTTNTTTVTSNTTTVTNNYSGNAYNYTITNNTSTTVNGVPSGTTSEQVAPQPEDTAVVTDTDMPPLPTLYTRKYPDGIQGVWNTRSTEMKATPLFGLSAIFSPTVGSGSCPSWTFDANIGPHMNFGQGVISPPCWLWPLLKAVIIITALLISRRLVFGG